MRDVLALGGQHEDVDAVTDRVARRAERVEPLGLVPLDLGRVVDAPVRQLPHAGMVGHASFASSQTVMSQPKDSPRKRSTDLLVWLEMSIPTSSMTAIASGRTMLASIPALETSKRSPPQARSMPSAIWLRALLCQHTKMTRCGSAPISRACYDRCVNGASNRVNVHGGDSLWIRAHAQREFVEKGLAPPSASR